jgi:hypothetical protein
LLGELSHTHPNFHLPARWLEALDAPRWENIALRDPEPRSEHPDRGRRRRRPKGSRHARRSGILLSGMRTVWVFVESSAPQDSAPLTSSLLAELCLPGVPPLLATGTLDDQPAFAVAASGVPLDATLDRKGGVTRDAALRICSDLVSTLGALAQAGVTLPDTHLRRFDQDSAGRVWLTDLRGAHRTDDPGELLALTRATCRHVLDSARRFVPPVDLPQSLDSAQSFADLLRLVQPR